MLAATISPGGNADEGEDVLDASLFNSSLYLNNGIE
jgi:hypothetical protein